MALSSEQRALLQRYRGANTTGRQYGARLATEIVPPLIFLALWAWTGAVIFLLALIAMLVLFNLVRVVRQQAYLRQLKALADQLLELPVEESIRD